MCLADDFLADGDNLIEETNSSGTAEARYSQGLNIDEPLAQLRTGTTSYDERKLEISNA
jgi:hypothetical protein